MKNSKHANAQQWRCQWGGQGGQSAPLTAKKLPKIEKKGEKDGKKREKIGKKRKNREGSFTLPLLTDRAGYATDAQKLWIKRHGSEDTVEFKQQYVYSAKKGYLSGQSWAPLPSVIQRWKLVWFTSFSQHITRSLVP